MIVQTVREISLDVSKNQYIRLDVKQYDRNTRYILITCYHQGEFIPINKNSHFASIRYWKPDEQGVFNTCEITQDGKILVELTEQMLAVAGVCNVDVVIHENINLSVDVVENADGTIKIVDTGNSGIVSTMTFVVYVHEAAFDNELVESSYEYNALNDLVDDARRNYENVATKCYEYKNTTERYMNTTEGYMDVTEGYKNTTKGYMDNTYSYMSTTQGYMDTTKSHMDTTKGYMDVTDGYMDTTKGYMENTQSYMDATEGYMDVTDSYMDVASTKATEASNSASAAKTSESNAKTSETNAKVSETNAKTSEDNVKTSEANIVKYYTEAIDLLNSTKFVFVPKGSIFFSELATVKETAVTGYVYNIKDDFVTDDTFREGAGQSYTAGTNVYYVIDENGENKWDCFGGSSPSSATVDEVKSYLGI